MEGQFRPLPQAQEQQEFGSEAYRYEVYREVYREVETEQSPTVVDCPPPPPPETPALALCYTNLALCDGEPVLTCDRVNKACYDLCNDVLGDRNWISCAGKWTDHIPCICDEGE